MKVGGIQLLEFAYLFGSVSMLLFGSVALLMPNMFSSYYDRTRAKSQLKKPRSEYLEKQLFFANLRLGGAALVLIGLLLTIFFISDLE